MEPRGEFCITVIEGKGLAVKDMGGKSDPYCVLSCSGIEKRTETKMKTLNPSFNESFEFDIYNPDLATVVLEIYDWDKFSRDDFMGTIDIPVRKYTNEEQQDVWLKLEKSDIYPREKVKGEIHCKLKYTMTEFAEEETLDEYTDSLTTLFDVWGIDGLKDVLIKTKPDNETARALTRLYLNKGQFVNLFVALVEHEVEKTQQETALFRTDSWATKIMQAYSRLAGLEYLKLVLGESVRLLTSTSHTTELDPSRLSADQDIKDNRMNMLQTAEMFLLRILNSIPHVPKSMATLFTALRSAVNAKYPDSSLKQVGGFFFLRFLCPAIWQPDTFALVDAPPSAEQRRALVLMAKMLMNLSNGVEFGEKEDFMVPMNSFITSHINDVQAFFERVSTDGNECDGEDSQVSFRARDVVNVCKTLKLK